MALRPASQAGVRECHLKLDGRKLEDGWEDAAEEG